MLRAKKLMPDALGLTRSFCTAMLWPFTPGNGSRVPCAVQFVTRVSPKIQNSRLLGRAAENAPSPPVQPRRLAPIEFRLNMSSQNDHSSHATSAPETISPHPIRRIHFFLM